MNARPAARGGWRLRALTALTVGAIAWGAFAFGAVYPWGFTPLLIASLTIAILSFTIDVPATCNRPVAICLLAVALTIAVQLLPITRSTLHRISPGSDKVLQRYDLNYANFTSKPHVLSIDPPGTRRALVFCVSFGLLLIGLSRVLSGRQVTRLATWITGLAALVALVGIIQRASFNGKIYGVWESQMPSTPFGPFINRNHFAGWMLMALPLAVGLFCAHIARGREGSLPWRRRFLWLSSPDASRIVLIGFAIVAMALSLVLSLSRLGLCGIAIALLVSGRLVMRHRSQSADRGIAYGYVLLLIVVSSASVWAGLDQGVARFTDPGARDLGGRLPIWADTARIIRDFPIAGIGLNTYGTAMLFYQTTLPAEHVRQAHNDYLQLAAEGGLLVGIPIALAIVMFIREVYLRFREGYDNLTIYWIRTGAVAGLAAVALQSIGEFSLQMPGNAMLFTVLCAIALHKSRRDDPGPLASSRR
jgi:putative inorganic carbon (HCO3(-)) transporter